MENKAQPECVPARRIRDIYSTNHFMNDYFHIDIETIRCGEVTVAMTTDPAIHTNHRGVIHGGVFAALFDAVTGVTSCTLGGAMAVTTNMTIDYIRNVTPGKRIAVTSHVLHAGKTTIVMEAKMTDEDGKLMGNMTATMLILGHYDGVPEKW